MVAGMWMGYHYPYPPSEPRLPTNLGLQDLFVLGMTSPFLDSTDHEEMWEKFDLPYRPEMMVNFGANLMMSIANKETVAASLAKYKFIVSFDLFLTETSNFADIVLPDCGYLQSLDSRSNFPFIFSQPAGMGEWCWPIRQPVLPPDGEQRHFADVLLELADRVGFRADLNAAFNASLNLQAPHRLERETALYLRGDLRRRAEEQFRPRARAGLVQGARRHQMEEEARGSLLAPLRRRARADLLGVHAADRREDRRDRRAARPQDSAGILRAAAGFPALPLARLQEAGFRFLRLLLSRHRPHQQLHHGEPLARRGGAARSVLLHDRHQRGGGDARELSTTANSSGSRPKAGRKVKGRVKLTEAIHPEGLGIAALCGHWSDGMPVAKGKGVFFNDLLELDWEHVSPVNINLDLCAKVRVVPVEVAS